jgi:hypothetical protein
LGFSDAMQMLPTSCPTSLHISGGRDKNDTELVRALFCAMIFYGVVFVVVAVEREWMVSCSSSYHWETRQVIAPGLIARCCNLKRPETWLGGLRENSLIVGLHPAGRTSPNNDNRPSSSRRTCTASSLISGCITIKCQLCQVRIRSHKQGKPHVDKNLCAGSFTYFQPHGLNSCPQPPPLLD